VIISDGAIKIRCKTCGAKRPEAGFKIQIHYMWKNQHGCCIRMFCHVCGQVTDVTEIYSQSPDKIKYEKRWTFDIRTEIPF